jgi:hypothetical protein
MMMPIRHMEMVAYHEAGHAVIAHMLGAEVRRVAINKEDGGGVTSIKRLGRGERASSSIWRGRTLRSATHRAHTRVESATPALTAAATSTMSRNSSTTYMGKVADAYWRYVEARAEALVEQHWKKIDAVAKALLKQGTIAGDIREFFPRVIP